MGKRKRSRSKDRDYENILEKVRKLEKRLKRRERRISSSSAESTPENVEEDVDINVSENHSPLRDMELDEPEMIQSTSENTSNNASGKADPVLSEEPLLDPNVLSILGDDPVNQSTFGEKLHKDISPRWQHILTKGLSKEVKVELIKLYLTPENCIHLKAPKLHLEIKAALTEINLRKDNFSESKQNQLSSGIAAIGKALNIALSGDNSSSRELIKYLSDAGRLLCDYHYRESESRRYAIINTLNKQTRDTIKDTKIDEYLFGSELADHLKSSKAIAKSGSELKPVYATRVQPKPVATTQPTRGALNSRGASRAAASETRPYAAARRLPAAPPTTTKDRRREATTSRSTYHRHRGGKR